MVPSSGSLLNFCMSCGPGEVGMVLPTPRPSPNDVTQSAPICRGVFSELLLELHTHTTRTHTHTTHAHIQRQTWLCSTNPNQGIPKERLLHGEARFPATAFLPPCKRIPKRISAQKRNAQSPMPHLSRQTTISKLQTRELPRQRTFMAGPACFMTYGRPSVSCCRNPLSQP